MLKSYLKKDVSLRNPIAAPKTPDYRPNLDDNMDSFPDPNLDSEPEETSPPASQLEPRKKAELAKQNEYEGKNLAQVNLPRNSQSKRQPRKRKHEDAISALQFKKQKTETSILKLERHLEQKACPKSFQYKAKANVTPDDETFRKEISAIKSRAEEQLVSALYASISVDLLVTRTN